MRHVAGLLSAVLVLMVTAQPAAACKGKDAPLSVGITLLAPASASVRGADSTAIALVVLATVSLILMLLRRPRRKTQRR